MSETGTSATPSGAVRRVLFVDDEELFLETVRELMGVMSQGQWEILTATSASQAFGMLQKQPVDLAVIDMQMGVMDGLQMLSLLNRGYPTVQKVVLTGFVTEKYRTACLSNGAELFLQKPTNPSGWQSLYGILNELLKLHSEEGFRGVLRRVGLQDIIQMECLARSSSILEISHAGGTGRIFIETGQIIHAEVGALAGEEAFNHLLALTGGQFVLKPFHDPPQRSIDGQWEFLLMEAARKSDETREALAASAPGVPAAEHITAEATQLEAERAADPSKQNIDYSYGNVPVVPPGVATQPQVDELLILSHQGEIVYEWQCHNPDLWVNFFEFISQRGQRLAQLLPLGDFDRLEIQSGGVRAVVLLTPNHGAMVKTRKVAV
ncbi:MAG TPA: response regulator [Verrucomicrobiota bacterium]|nr:response regulator [Verrucomicrobiota bacterium]HNT15419.1 response regulator [Verrucomicrobiota bacterium]